MIDEEAGKREGYKENRLKGTVRRDVTRVKNRLKQFVLTNYITALLYFLILKRHLHQRSKKQFQRLNNNDI
jgi:hypothetical protein